MNESAAGDGGGQGRKQQTNKQTKEEEPSILFQQPHIHTVRSSETIWCLCDTHSVHYIMFKWNYAVSISSVSPLRAVSDNITLIIPGT